MDYDDTEFQGHNTQLVEGSSKLSSVLQPYPLPKFDFDDSLQGHLRFDSLVENEVFLGIPSQEDNHWMEDFSRGNSEIKFNSSATESCAITRHNNVWSEVTSSESVEMLLKSVGQEQKVSGELINGESDTGNELGSLTKEMEHSSKQDDKRGNATYTEPESALVDFSGAECTSEALEEDPPIGGNLTKASIVSAAVSKGNVGADRNCDDANQVELETSVTECLVDNMKEPTSISGEHIGNNNSLPQNVNANSPCGEFKDQENKIEVANVSFKSVDVLLNDNSKEVVEEDASSKQSNMVGQILSVTADEICTNEVEGPRYDTSKGMVDDNHDDDGNKRSDMLEEILRETANETCVKKVGDPIDVASGMESVVEHNLEINTDKFGEPSGSAVKEDEDHQISDRRRDAVNSAEPQDFYVVNVNDGPEISKHSQSSINEDLHAVYLEDGVSKEQGIGVGENRFPSSYPELEVVAEEKDNDLGADHDTTSLVGQKTELPTEVSNMDCAVVGLLCSGEGDVGKTRIANGSECEGSIGNVPELKVIADDTNLSSFDTLYGGTGTAANEIASHNDGVKLLVLGMIPMEASENEEEITDSRSEACISDLKKSLQVADNLELLPETGKASQGDQAVVEVGQECSEKCEACPVIMDSPVKEVENTEAAVSEKEEEVLMGRNVQLASEDVAGQTIKDCQSILSKQVHKISMDTEDSAFASGISKIDLKMVPENSCESPQPLVQEIEGGGASGATERKKRRGFGKAASKESAKKGNHVKESTPMRRSERDDNSAKFIFSPGTDQLLQSEELKRCGDAEQSATKSCGVVPISTYNLPDLNSSVSPVAFFQQPFTDLQQVQLRAQIFVYGSLIQESVPDEASMLSAFGPSDGSRNLWEPAWRACVERVNVQRSRTNLGTPVRSGGKAADKPIKNSPAGQATSGIPKGATVDFHQPLSPLNPCQVPGIRNFVGHSSSWLSQTSFPGPWVTSPQTTTFDANTRYSMFPNTEPVKLTPAKDSAVQNFPATNHASVITFAHAGGDVTVSSGTSSKLGVEKVSVSTIKHSTDPKPRKRKKVPAAEDPGQIPLPALHQAASVSSPSVSCQLSEKARVTEGVFQKSFLDQSQTEAATTASVSNICSSSVGAMPPLRITSPTFISDQPELMGQKLENKSITADEALNSVEESKRQAEAASVHAAATVNHYQDVWIKLGKQQTSGLISDVEAKLAYTAVAIAAAASVSKAAAAAAKIASDVALQAKLMADEVSSSSLIGISNQSAGLSLSRVSTGSGSATHSSILKSGDGSTSASSIIAFAREAARKRVEAASAASRHAENLDAIVKAAELASEAVSQAGKIVSMGDPFPLCDFMELGPLGYWKNSKVSPEEGAKSHNVDKDDMKAVNVKLHNISAEQSSRQPSGTFASLQKDPSSVQRVPRTSELPKPIDIVAASDVGSMPDVSVAENSYTITSKGSMENEMKEGCLIEVFKDGSNYKAAWYSANILNLKDGKAFLCYTELQEENGSGQLKEWVPLGDDGINTPTVRIAHPKTTLRLDGSKKRRRAEVMDYNWSVGDRVDAWMRECWREGIVKEKKQNDETELTVHFPAHGDTSVVRAWHLRPTLIWQDGEWIEWSGARQHSPSQGDTPQEKRMKLGSPAIEARGKDKIPSGLDLVELRKHEESSLLPLSASEKEFNVGKITINDNKVNAQRAVRTGLLKEGSKVVFGIPKPGKKRKFMDVSGHFDSEHRSKNVKASESLKFSRYLMSSGSSRGWTNSTKIDVKEKQAPENKLKVVRSRKPPSSSGRALPKKDNFIFAKSARHDASMTEEKLEDSIGNEENNASQDNILEFESFSNSQDTLEGSTLVSSLGLPQVAPNKVPLSNAKSERLNKGKIAPAGRRLGKKAVLQDNGIPEVVEPRRSNRKIQPTSRLLEGLQSSLIISKIPSFPHGKSHRSQNRSNFRREH